MAKLQHTFVQGKMNKDLDERLIPNGQYRDASNVQVSTSEGADVGAVENILGNSLKNIRIDSAGTTTWPIAPSGFGLTGTTCIGSAIDTQNEKIYWFITSTTADIIFEYDQILNVVNPILVDPTGAILNFNANNFITGINIFNGLLFWTDDLNEPRVIDIATFKTGSNQGGISPLFSVPTTVYGTAFAASDITVIKLKPKTAPAFAALPSLRGNGLGAGTGVTPVTTIKDFTVSVGGADVPLLPGDSATIVCSATPLWQAGDVVVLRTFQVNEQNFKEYFEVRATVNTTPTTTTVNLTILYVTLSLTGIDYTWDCLLEEKEPMFNLSMPRFGYRWKYVNNEYSAYSPFTEAVFVPGPYSYDPSNAYNRGMENNLRSLTINGLEASPKGAVSIDILYKDSASSAIYRVDTIPATATSLTITSELIYSILPSNQLLRPYDNVPLKAKAQEVIGNRIVYGNYVQNFDIGEAVDISVTAPSTNITKLLSPEQTIKSQRAYQIGLVYLDAFGRETPVFTNDEATIIIPKLNAPKATVLSAKAEQDAPSFAKFYKFYVKDISNEYYNLILDRYYDSDDGNIWLSFPSAERNKVSIDDFLILKKQHNSNTPVTDDAKYKIIDISNEAPPSVKTFREFYTNSVVTKGTAAFNSGTSEFIPINSGLKEFNFDGPTLADSPLFFNAFSDPTVIYIRFRRFANSTPKLSQYYLLDRAGFEGATTTAYIMALAEPISVADDWLNGIGAGGKYTIEIHVEEEINSPAFEGKFFAKINRDSVFEDNVIYNFTTNPGDFETSALSPDISATIPNAPINGNPTPSIPQPNQPQEWYGWAENAAAQPSPTSAQDFQYPTIGLFKVGFGMAPYWETGTGPGNNGAGLGIVGTNFINKLIPGATIQFKGANGLFDGALYEVATVSFNTYANRGSGNFEPSRTFTFTLTEPFSDVSSNFTQMRIMKRKRAQSILFDEFTKVLGSPNGAIFETEPAEAIDLNLYYEATNALPIAGMGNNVTLPYFNAYSFGNGVESNRVRDDYNATVIGKGTKVSTVLEGDYKQERRKAGMIYGGIFNNTNGFNEVNQFIAGLKITKDLNPVYGSIQKLHARDTDLIVLMEDKCFRILADKDALFNADGSSNVATSNQVLGSITPYVGEFGISKNPESFASFGFRTYFVDKARGSVMRLSRDGLTKISSNGMSDYFVDNLKLNTTGKIIGSYDSDAGSYNVSIGLPVAADTESVAFKEKVNGWTTTMSYVPESGISLNNEYYTFKNGEIWEHSNETRSNFYGAQFNSTVTPIINDAPTSVKKFKTLAYEGTAGWRSEIVTDQQNGEVPVFVKKEGSFYNYIQGIDTTVANLDTQEFSTQGLGSLLLNAPVGTSTIVINGAINVSLQANPQNPGGGAAGTAALDTIYTMSPGNTLRIVGTVIGINRTTNTITLAANIAGSALQAGDFVFFGKDTRINTSGIIGYYAETKMITTDSTKEELFAVSSEVFISSE